MFASTLFLAAVCSAPPDGEQILQDLDKKIVAAKTVRIEFEVNQENGGLVNTIGSGVVRIADKNRFRMEIDYVGQGRQGREVTICDGTTAVRLTGPSPAELRKTESRRARQTAGTTVWLSELDPDVLRVLTQRKLVDYLRARRGPALAAGAYSSFNLSGSDMPERIVGLRVTASWFGVFEVPPMLGRTFTAAEDQPGRARVAARRRVSRHALGSGG